MTWSRYPAESRVVPSCPNTFRRLLRHTCNMAGVMRVGACGEHWGLVASDQAGHIDGRLVARALGLVVSAPSLGRLDARHIDAAHMVNTERLLARPGGPKLGHVDAPRLGSPADSARVEVSTRLSGCSDVARGLAHITKPASTCPAWTLGASLNAMRPAPTTSPTSTCLTRRRVTRRASTWPLSGSPVRAGSPYAAIHARVLPD